MDPHTSRDDESSAPVPTAIPTSGPSSSRVGRALTTFDGFDAPRAVEPWPMAQRIVYKFAAIYVILYTLGSGNSAALPLILVSPRGVVPSWYTQPTDAIFSRVGHLLGVAGEISAADNGSSDRTGNYISIICFALVAAVGAAVWSFADRRSQNHSRGLHLLRIWVRYWLATATLAYGFFKVFPVQFPVPDPLRLVQTYGESSPMGLLWTFMGASPPYTMLAGWLEVIGALLLFFRRTVSIGALLLTVVLGNVFVLNLCYDVLVKTFSFHSVAMAIFLAYPELRAIAKKLFGPNIHTVHRAPRRVRWVKAGVVLGLIMLQAVPAAEFYFTEGDGSPRPSLYGVYQVQELRRDGAVVQPLLTDHRYWRYVAVDRRITVVEMLDGSKIGFTQSFDDGCACGSLRGVSPGAPALSITSSTRGAVEVRGVTEDGTALYVLLGPLEINKSRLLTRGFHWINNTHYHY